MRPREISLSRLRGYCPYLELARRVKFAEFRSADAADEKRRALQSLASLTAMRSSTFVESYERALGLRDD